ncbi:hypothetical protein A2778_05020 [Candidatus Daviesbacteria bacterium RIFCSPHIGHO2_01_FULL_40_24]|nr:MAG: hypothetical protein A2778_05020 [Candidatus Daviesbacteria bacterium RIFCSPHIGHO2_01_FULL_40_24]OGE29134.1 MAG: hypothetical protein A3C29_04855 [Candidatus Daviesbacteria bacterium RIFCSPHIGHO2_02_FULL_40_16]OGE43089.1 MAG: hypothetical protein A3A53_00860 [Candidatus Daviesbacteria bacterium RIFCSPLOWO2_01_FULL_39_23]OGE67431.1 MAG: hypothetical protein A3J16_03780 [Candidatus Daviesbacteria bacterium RIFCSPLOWO2_02_FULL_39_13]
MKKIYFTVGPSQVYPTLHKHMGKAIKEEICSLNHRSQQFKNLYKETADGLKKLLNVPENFQIFFVSSATESMERVIQSCCQDTSFHIVAGAFGKAWSNYASQVGKNAVTHIFENTPDVNLDNLTVPKAAEIICITQNETSTGCSIPIEEIINLKKKNPEKLVAIDIVSSAPYIDINFKYIDIAFFSVQKGFGLPAGLAVIIAGPKALEKTEKMIKKGIKVGSYHSFRSLSEKAKDYQTPLTPNVLNIYLLNSVVKDMLKLSANKIRKDTEKKAQMIYGYFKTSTRYFPFIKNPLFCSPTTPVLDVLGDSEQIRKKLSKKGFIIGAGYGTNRENHIRIANFPAHTIKNVSTLLKHIRYII